MKQWFVVLALLAVGAFVVGAFVLWGERPSTTGNDASILQENYSPTNDKKTPRVTPSTQDGAPRSMPEPAPKKTPLRMSEGGDPLVSARVFGAEVLASALDTAVRRAVDATREQAIPATVDWLWLEDVRARHLSELIDEQILIHHLRTKSIQLPPTAIDDALNAEIAARYGGDRALFLAALEAQQLTEADVRRRLHQNLVQEHVLARLGRIEPDARDLSAVYARSQDQFRAPARARLDLFSLPLSPDAPDTSDSPENTPTATQITARLREGAPLDGLLVEAVSYEAIPLVQLPPSMRYPVSIAPAGALVGPVRGASGLYWAKIHTHYPAEVLPLADPGVSGAVYERARRDLLALRRRQLLETLRPAAEITRFDNLWHRRFQRRARLILAGPP